MNNALELSKKRHHGTEKANSLPQSSLNKNTIGGAGTPRRLSAAFYVRLKAILAVK